MLFWICAWSQCGYATANEGQIVAIIEDVDTHGSVTLRCQTRIPPGASSIYHSWIFHDKILTQNIEVLANISSRYSVSYLNSFRNDYKLIIKNPVQTDEGNYRCEIEYTSLSNTSSVSKVHRVKISSYLPPLNYPLCSVQPSTTLTNGRKASFKCKVGETTAQITLLLTLQSTNAGYVKHLADGNGTRSINVTETITFQDNNSMFVCRMTSKTFPTAYRNCTVGPLIIQEEQPYTEETLAWPLSTKYATNMNTTPPTWTNQPGTSSTKVMTEIYRNDSTPKSNLSNSTKMNDSNSTRRKVFILNLVWCASGALILSLLIIICAVLCQGRSSKNACTTTSSLKSVRRTSDNALSSKPRRYRSQHATSRNQPSVVGHSSSYDARPNQIPLYAIVHETNSDDENSLDTNAANPSGVEEYEDINLTENDLMEPFKASTQKSQLKILGVQTNKTAIPDGCEDIEIPAQDDLEESSMNGELNFPRSETMHYKDSSITPGQSPFYAIVHQCNSSDEDVSNSSAKATVKYENVDFQSKPKDLSSSSQVQKANKKLKVEAMTGDNNSPDSSELVDNIIYVSSGP